MIFESLPEASVNGALQSLYNHAPWMTLTYFMARSAEVAHPRSQVSIYRTIGPLVDHFNERFLTIYLSYSHIPMLPFQIFGPPYLGDP